MNDAQMRNGECGMGDDIPVGLKTAAGSVLRTPYSVPPDNSALSLLAAAGTPRSELAGLNPEPSLPAEAGTLTTPLDDPPCATGSASAFPAPDDPRVAGALAQYAAALDSGRPLDRHDFLTSHADIAEPLAECLEALEFIHGAAAQVHGDNGDSVEQFAGMPAPLALGDFRIVREIGRGGMGVVYEAEQLSLARRVALKVLPFASMLDPRRLQRFRNEALAAASLKHPNIVSVYCVGCERGVHFYAMEYVEGQTLAAVIEALRVQGSDWDESPLLG